MPVVELDLNRIQSLVGKKSNRKKILDVLPFLGLDIESHDGDNVRVEFSPNRPDYSTDFGIALGLQGLLGIKTGILKTNVKKQGDYQIKVDPTTSKIRPFVTGIIAKNGSLDDDSIKQLMNMQEDLHFGIGRKRKKSSIGLHDLDKISFPLKYTTTDREHKFTPLNSDVENTISEILQNTDVGKNYGDILAQSSKVPIIFDANNNTISFPPIINSALTTVTSETKNILVEVTGIEKQSAEDMLAVVTAVLENAGFGIYQLKISGSKNSTPILSPRSITIDSDLTNRILGLNLSLSVIISCLKKCRLDAKLKNKKIECSIPRYRFDIFGPMDLVEEIALGYGINNLNPSLPVSQNTGSKHSITKKLDNSSLVMVGLGFMEVLNSSLTSKKILYEMTNTNSSDIISVTGSKSQDHTILRDSILPGLLENLSSNVHETYPQKLFESGIVFSKDSPIKEKISLASVNASKNANFSDMKAVLESFLRTSFNLECETKTTSNNTLFTNGRVANIIINNQNFGQIGEIDSSILENFRIRTSVTAFEITLSGLIFD